MIFLLPYILSFSFLHISFCSFSTSALFLVDLRAKHLFNFLCLCAFFLKCLSGNLKSCPGARTLRKWKKIISDSLEVLLHLAWAVSEGKKIFFQRLSTAGRAVKSGSTSFWVKSLLQPTHCLHPKRPCFPDGGQV